MKKAPMLEMKNIKKSFPGVMALKGVNLKVYSGQVMGLLGENGAGKSTLMKILSGVYKKDEGNILINGEEIEVNGIKDAQKLGISIIHQELSLLKNLKVYENIYLGCEKTKGLGKLSKKEMVENCREYLKDIGCNINPEEEVKNITVGEMQMIEIAKAISKNSRMIIMDEPTTALTDVETKKLFGIIRKLKAQEIGIIYISHRMDEIFEICDGITVLRDGGFIGEKAIDEIDKDELISMMVGRRLEEQFPHVDVKPGEVLLKVDNVSYKNKVKNVSLEVRRGEILGIAGLMGSGRTEVAKLIFGEYKKSSGEIMINGKKLEMSSPKDAIKNKIAYLSEDRKKEGLVLNLTVGHNMTLSNLERYENKFRKINKKLERQYVGTFSKRLTVKTTGYDQVVKNLSGGNQQKVIIAKWLMIDPEILIIDEPTKGIDVGAKKEIYEILNDLKKLGKAIIMISSEMEEILGVSDRIVVMSEGKITGEVAREEANQEIIMKYAVGLN